jgi:sarcosine oxidase / L-pipecolate oxidase
MTRLRCGVLSLGAVDDYFGASKAYTNQVALGQRVVKLDAGDPIRTVFPSNIRTGALFDQFSGYLNLDSGWALATRGLEKLMTRVIALGAKVVGGRTVTGLVRDGDGMTLGVTLADGSCMTARLVIIATGAWTASTFRELDFGEMCLSTG